MDAETTEKLLLLKLKRAEAVATKIEEMKNGCNCKVVDDKIKDIEEQILYLEFNGVEYVPEIEII